MFMAFDKNMYKFGLENSQVRMKNGGKNNNKKIHNKNPSLYKEYLYSSPLRDIISNNKKISYANIHQNNNKMTSNYEQTYNINNHKKNLKYNRSFEGNKINNDFMSNSNFDFLNDNLNTINYNKNQNTKKFNNNSVILNNKPKKGKNKHNNKSVARTINSYGNTNIKKSNMNENVIIKKLDEKFKSLENNIIDKKYENDIDNDEMIISSNKKAKNGSNGIYNNKLSNIIGVGDNYNEKGKDDFKGDLFKNDIEIDENYLLNTSFENNRSDFNIMYTPNYEKTVIDDMLSLEIKLLVEKMLEIQKSYHKELNNIISQYNNNNKIFKALIQKVRELQKKSQIIRNINEKKRTKQNIYNFINIYHNNNQHEISKINKNEFNLWSFTMLGKKNKTGNVYNHGKLKELFKILVFDRYHKISGKMNSLENKIILGLMKNQKYNNNRKNSTGSGNSNSNNKYYDNEIYKVKLNKIGSTPGQQYKNMNKKNRNDSSTINNRKKHKKISSCGQPNKHSKYLNFKNIKK